MLELPWSRPNVAVRARKCGVTMAIQWCADEQGYIGLAFRDGEPVLAAPIGPYDTVLECDVQTEMTLYRLGLWRPTAGPGDA